MVITRTTSHSIIGVRLPNEGQAVTTEQNPYPDPTELPLAPPAPLNRLGTAGFVLGLLVLVICVLWPAVLTKATGDVNKPPTEVVAVHYEVTGDATNVTINYSTYDDGVSNSQESAIALPWTKELQVKGMLKGGSLTVTADVHGGTVACKVFVAGKQARTSSSSGPFATAFCSDF
jgi:hypothetical protein